LKKEVTYHTLQKKSNIFGKKINFSICFNISILRCWPLALKSQLGSQQGNILPAVRTLGARTDK
jgi:hypothetical protein